MASITELAGLGLAGARLRATLCQRSSGLTVQVPYRPSTGALHLLIDSTEIKAAGEGEWSTRKHGAFRPRQWRKVHRGVDADTMEARAIEITGSRIWDGPMLPELLAQMRPMEPTTPGPVTRRSPLVGHPIILVPLMTQRTFLERDHTGRPDSQQAPRKRRDVWADRSGLLER